MLEADQWPAWWKGLEGVVLLEPATGPHQVGSLRRFTWKGVLPYRLAVEMRLVRAEPMRILESRASGELEGTGLWRFSQSPQGTIASYDWNVRTTKPWMNQAAAVARPLFVLNHNIVMRRGEAGLIRHLRVR